MTAVAYWRLIAIFALAAVWVMCTLPIGPDGRVAGFQVRPDESTEQMLVHDESGVANATSPQHANKPKKGKLAATATATAAATSAEIEVQPTETPKNRLLVTFAYFESDTARENLQYFIKHGLHDAADFVFIFNGGNDNGRGNATSMVPKRDNIKIVERDNTCFDLGATGEVLRHKNLWKKYDRFIIMNASLRGPFLPHWSESCWSDLFLGKLSEEVKLVGITVNCKPRFHVQSMIWATDRIGMGLLIDPIEGLAASVGDGWGSAEDLVGLGGCYNEYIKAIHAEIGSTSIITGAGYKVDVMMTSYHGIRTPDPTIYCNSIPKEVEDTLREGDYFGFTIHPYETIFIKTNRNINPGQIAHLTRWMGNGGYSSYPKCSATRGGDR